MKVLIVAATEGEIAPLPTSPKERRCDVTLLITGVGMVATTYALTRHLQHNKYDLVLQVGVAGSFNPDIAPGSVVFITDDQFADLGAEDHNKYLDIFEMGLADRNSTPYTDGSLLTPMLPVHEKIKLQHVKGITVNTVSGNEQTIRMRAEKYGADVESMEGAAFHMVCMQENVPFAQVRAISNYVTPRDKSQWKMKEAVVNLNSWLTGFINTL
jgi:futalosine hydrolase